MKTAIYIEDGIAQLVITPESEFEKNAMAAFEDKEISAKVMVGSFYDCRGGWVKQNAYRPKGDFAYTSMDTQERSVILRVDTKKGGSE